MKLILPGLLMVAISSQAVEAGFIDNGDATATDTDADLRWQLTGDGELRDFPAANEYCRELIIGNYSDWRLPGVNELLSLLSYDKLNKLWYESPAPYPLQFMNGVYWTDSFIQGNLTAGGGYQEAWIINFGNGVVGLEPLFFGKSNNSYYVHCVHEQNPCQASYSPDGTLHIPCVKTGSAGSYSVDMKLQSTEPAMRFEVLKIQSK